MKKKYTILIIILILFIDFLVLFLKREKDYVIEYKTESGEIVEKFNKKLNMYSFSVKIGDNIYETSASHKYIHSKKLIDKVNYYEDNDITCVYLSGKVELYPICKNSDGYVSYSKDYEKEDFYSLKNIKEDNREYGKIKINTTLGKKILIWNHYGFDNVSDENNINFLSDEVYADNYSFMVSNYILIPNYDEKYIFKSFYIINMNTLKVNKWDMDVEINYDFYYLGSYKNKGYIVDKKSKVEYEINPKKKSIEIVSKNGIGKIWNDGWNEESIIRLSSNNYEFNISSFVNYHLDNNKLLMTPYEMNNVLVTDTLVDRIIKQDGLDIYYISKNTLYYFNPFYGEVKIAEYSEFEFNKNMTIYIY